MPKRKRIRPVGIVVVPRTKKDQERRDALSPREAFKRKAEEKAQKGKEQAEIKGPVSRFSKKEQEMLRELLKQKAKQDAEEKAAKKALERKIPKELKKPKEPETEYPIRRVPKTRKKPPTSRRV